MTEATRSRLRRDQLKALVLDAGVQLLLEDGIAAKTAPLGYADAFRWLKEHRGFTVSRAQVHRRIWDSLADYRDDVMTNVVQLGFPSDVLHGTEANAAAALEELPIAEADGEQRVAMLCELARRLTDLNAEALRTRPAIAAADALFLMHALGTDGEARSPAVRDAIVSNKNDILDAYVDLYDQIGEAFGVTAGGDWRMSPDDGVRMYAEVISCLNHGAAGRSSFDRSLQELHLGGEVWSVEAFGVYAITGHVASLNGPRAHVEEGCVVGPLLVTESNNDNTPIPTHTYSNAADTMSARMDRGTLRQHMIDAGTALLIARGYGHGGEQITYRRVFDRIKDETGIVVARAQVHRRIWASQNDFQLDVLAKSAKQFVSDGLNDAADAAVNAIDSVDRTAPDWQRKAVARAVRDGSIANVEALMVSTSWLLGRAILSFHALSSSRSRRVGRALRVEYEASLSNWTNLFEATAVGLGLRAKPWTKCTLSEACRIAAQCTDVLSDGVVARSRMLGQTPTYSVEIAGDELTDWNILGLGAWCVIDQLMEPDPEKANS